MVKLSKDEEEYGNIPVKERARMIVGMKLPEWMGILEQDRQIKKMEARGNAGRF